MALRRLRLDQAVGFSSEFQPSSLHRTEFPDAQNCHFDQGGVCVTRDAYKRLSSESIKDASWRLRGARYSPEKYHEYRDSILIPHHTKFDDMVGGTPKFYFSFIVQLADNLAIHPTYLSMAPSDAPAESYHIISKGNTSAWNTAGTLPFQVYLHFDSSSGVWQWKCAFWNSTGVAATATVTITEFEQINTGDKVNLIATDGTNYDFTNGDQSSVNGTWESTSSNNQTATNLMNVINTSSGPAGTRFTATSDGAVVTITQAVTGASGNTAITLTDSGTAGMSKTDFTGGATAAIHYLTVADASLTNVDGAKRFVEVGKLHVDGKMSMRVIDISDNSQVGLAHYNGTHFSMSLGTQPWIIGAYPDDDNTSEGGKPWHYTSKFTGAFNINWPVYAPHHPVSAFFDPITTADGVDLPGAIPMKISELRFEGGFSTYPSLQWTSSNGMQKRELRKTEIDTSTVIAYYKCNEGKYEFLRDLADTAYSVTSGYSGNRIGVHGSFLNTAPLWIDKDNNLPYPTSSSATSFGVSTIRNHGLLFNGVDGVIMCRAGGIDTPTAYWEGYGADLVRRNSDPLVNLFISPEHIPDGWTVELVITPILRVGETAYPDRTLYSSAPESDSIYDSSCNPIEFYTENNKFVAKIRRGNQTYHTITSVVDVSDYSGDMVTLSLSFGIDEDYTSQLRGDILGGKYLWCVTGKTTLGQDINGDAHTSPGNASPVAFDDDGSVNHTLVGQSLGAGAQQTWGWIRPEVYTQASGSQADQNSGPFIIIGRKVNTVTSTVSNIESNPTVGSYPGSYNPTDYTFMKTDEPETYSGPSFHGVFHEFRMWDVFMGFAKIGSRANKEVHPADRGRLLVYMRAKDGFGNSLRSEGTSQATTILSMDSTNGDTEIRIPVSSFMDSRIIPSQGDGPSPSGGLVETYIPPKVTGAIDFRHIVGEKTSRELIFTAGCSLYSFDMQDSVLTEVGDGLFKSSNQTSMRVFRGTVYIANGGDVMAYDGDGIRFAGIRAPTKRPVIGVRVTASMSQTEGAIADGDYLFGYRYANYDKGIYSNMSPLKKVSLEGDPVAHKSAILYVTNIESPKDPQVTAIEIFATQEGDTTVLYRLATMEGEKLYDVTWIRSRDIQTIALSGSDTGFPTINLDATTLDLNFPIRLPHFPANAALPPTLGDLYRFGTPPKSTCLQLMGARMLYASMHEPGVLYFSRLDGGIQPEHVDVTPGAQGAIGIKTDAGDTIQALVEFDDGVIAYLRDSRAEITLSGIEPIAGFEIPFQVEIRDNERGTVSPNSVIDVAGSHVFYSESDIYIRGRTTDDNISSPPEDTAAGRRGSSPTRPKIGRTIRSQLDSRYLSNVVGMHRQNRQQVWFAANEGHVIGSALGPGLNRNNIILAYSYRERRWMRHIMPYIDYMLEVESDGDRRMPIGFVNGFVCQLDETNSSVDSRDTGFTAGLERTVNSVSSNTITLTTNNITAGSLKFRPVWIGADGDYKMYLISDNDSDGANDRLFLINAPGGTVSANDDVYVGSINPSIDVMVMPQGLTLQKRFGFIDIAIGQAGMSELRVNSWFNNVKFDPAVGNAEIKNRTITISSTDNQFVSFDLGGLGRVARMQFFSPRPGKDLSMAEIVFRYALLPEARTHV